MIMNRLASAPLVLTASEFLKLDIVLEPLRPLYRNWRQQKSKRRMCNWLFITLACLTLFAVVRISSDLRWWLFVHLRLTLLTVTNLADVRVASGDCLVQNIFRQKSETPIVDQGKTGNLDPDCWICESAIDARRIDANETLRIAQLSNYKLPLIIDGYKQTSWKEIHHIDDIMKLVKIAYDQYSSSDSCNFITSLPYYFEELLHRYPDIDERQQWFAQWQNCEHDLTKFLRVIYPRPNFLPLSFSTMGSSWIFLAHNYTARIHRMIDVNEPWFWLTQITGTGKLLLKPKSGCTSLCQSITLDLPASTTALISTSIWKLYYKPGTENGVESIAYGVESFQEARK